MSTLLPFGILLYDLYADIDALVADIGLRPLNKPPCLPLRPSTERTTNVLPSFIHLPGSPSGASTSILYPYLLEKQMPSVKVLPVAGQFCYRSLVSSVLQ
jgi:hypothetical protein